MKRPAPPPTGRAVQDVLDVQPGERASRREASGTWEFSNGNRALSRAATGFGGMPVGITEQSRKALVSRPGLEPGTPCLKEATPSNLSNPQATQARKEDGDHE
jgi:hypothetical protein